MASSTSATCRRPLSESGQKRVANFPIRQCARGPAPLASLEDLSVDKTASDSSPEERSILSKIGEVSGDNTPVTPTAPKGVLSVPTSPRIRISAASSPSQKGDSDSKESTPDRELFLGYVKTEFFEEEMTELKSSTEELIAEEEERARRKRERLAQLTELDKREEALKINDHTRKGSSSSVISDTLVPYTSAHSSRLSSLGSIGSPARRSPSPHKMLLETSFCGNKPILHPSIDLEDPPISTSNLMEAIMDSKLNSIKSPLEAKPPDIFNQRKNSQHQKVEQDLDGDVKYLKDAEIQKSSRNYDQTKSLQRRHEQQRRQLEHHEYHQKQGDTAVEMHTRPSQPPVKPKRSSDTKKTDVSKRKDDTKGLEVEPKSDMRQASDKFQKSPRLGKKVPVPQVPNIRDHSRVSPSPSNSNVQLGAGEHHSRQRTVSSSPHVKRKGKYTEDNGSSESTPSGSRKGSFANSFRKGDSGLSPVSPDSPGSSSGRKSPFSQFIRNAEKKLRSRSRSRSRSKSRDRELEDDTHDRRKVLSIFRPSRKKKKDGNKDGKNSDGDNSTSAEGKINSDESSHSIFKNQEFDMAPSNWESNQSIHNEGIKSRKEKAEDDARILSRDSSSSELSSFMNGANKRPLDRDNDQKFFTSFKPKDEIPDQQSKFTSLNTSSKVTDPSLTIKDGKVQYDIRSPHVHEKGTSNLDVKEHDDSLSISESERGSEVDYLKRKEKLGISATEESPDGEKKGLVSQDSDDEDLPYVPTTLPQERSAVAPMIPMRERPPKLKMTNSIDRPRSTTPINPGKLEEYKQSSQELIDTDFDKMTISIKVPAPGAVRVLPIRPKRQESKSWDDFCSEGLQSPRQLKQKQKQKKKHFKSASDSAVPAPPPLPSNLGRSPIKINYYNEANLISNGNKGLIKPKPQPPVDMSGPKKWIDFDELPSIVLKPVRKIEPTAQKETKVPSQAILKPAGSPRLKIVNIIGKKVQNNVENEKPITKEPPKSKVPPPVPLRSPTTELRSMTEKIDSEHSSEDQSSDSEEEKHTSVSSSEDLNTVRETMDDDYETSDLERLLAPVNECISKINSSISNAANESNAYDRRSPIPDNWEDFLLPPQPGRRSRLSSIGSDAGSITGSIRSPSPSCLFLETSFCGSQPIDDPALKEPEVPLPVARKLSGISMGDLGAFNYHSRGGSIHSSNYLSSQPDRRSIISDSSAEGGEYETNTAERGASAGGGGGGQDHLNPFGMDLGFKSNRSSIISQDQSPPESPSFNTSKHHPS